MFSQKAASSCTILFSLYKNSPYKYQTIYEIILCRIHGEVLSFSKKMIYKEKCGTATK